MLQKRRTAADEPFFLIRSIISSPSVGELVHDHAHGWHQLIYVSAGLMTVTTEQGAWVALPSNAVWVPAGIVHAIRFAEPSSLHSLYLRPDRDATLAGQCQTISVSPLLRELIIRATDHGMLDERDPIEAALAHLIVADFHRSDTPPFQLPQPASPKLRAAVMRQNAADITAVASAAGMSIRTLERRFRAETGMPIGRWRQHRTLLDALEKIAGGMAVKVAADLAGYASPSAFIAAFRKAFGVTPGKYFG